MAFLIMDSVPVNPWYNVVNAQCNVREQTEPDAVLPPIISGVGDAPFNMQRDQPLEVRFEWTQNGFFSGANLAAVLNFEVKFLFESWGSVEVGPALDLSAIVPYQAGVGFTYNFGTAPGTRIVIPPNTLPVGVYECMAVFQINFIPSGEKYFAGYVKFPAINVYEATV